MKKLATIVPLSFGLIWIIWGLVATRGDIRHLERTVESPKPDQAVISLGAPSEPSSPEFLTLFDFGLWEERFKEAGDYNGAVQLAMLRLIEPWPFEQLEGLVDSALERFGDHSFGNYDYWGFLLMAEKDAVRAIAHPLADTWKAGLTKQELRIVRECFLFPGKTGCSKGSGLDHG